MPRLFLRLLAVLMLAALPASAQEGVQISFGQSLRLDGSALEVTADQLSVDQTSGATEFSGNVLAVQGEMRISAGLISPLFNTPVSWAVVQRPVTTTILAASASILKGALATTSKVFVTPRRPTSQG